MDYSKLDKVDFDAIVTGELTHRALWMEESIDSILCDFFITDPLRVTHFCRAILHRECLTAQDKIDIVRALIPAFGAEAERVKLKALLNRVEAFKAWRNAMAHGKDVSGNAPPLTVKVEIVNRSGKSVVREITPRSHEEMLKQADALAEELEAARNRLRAHFKSKPVRD
jgi:hypothetical protein